MYDTPQEAALKAEIAQLRAENEYLRRAVDAPGRVVQPYGVEEDIVLRDMAPEIRLAKIGGVEANLAHDRKWHVIGSFDRMQEGGRLAVSYYADRNHAIDDMTFVNHILPKLHEKFIRQLAEIIVKSKLR